MDGFNNDSEENNEPEDYDELSEERFRTQLGFPVI